MSPVSWQQYGPTDEGTVNPVTLNFIEHVMKQLLSLMPASTVGEWLPGMLFLEGLMPSHECRDLLSILGTGARVNIY